MRQICYAIMALLILATGYARADDNMFPPAPAAKAAIDFDGRGFLIHGQRTFIVSGSLHYPRVPHELWRDRLLKMKRAGFNTVQTYAFWNYNEPQEGHWNFQGDGDIDAFLKLVHSLGMYATVRVGPYVCAEWDSGGYPVWLRFKPELRVREPNAAFEAAVDHWMDKIMAITVANQVHRGGSVIMVQLENEHPKGWGRDMPNEYFQHLRDKALALGLEVPYFFSGLHHGSDPAGGKSWDSLKRTTPWYTTEFWPGWYSDYGEFPADKLRQFDRGTWKIIAYGGNGYNYYMLHGGTDFSTWNDDEVASSYDYSGAIGQAGDLRTIYYRFKRAAWFARSLQSVTADSQNADAEFKDGATESALHITGRRGPAGAIAFLDNQGKQDLKTQIKTAGGALVPAAGPITITAGEIVPIVQDYALAPGVKLELCAGRLLGIAQEGLQTTLVVYGAAGDPAELAFDTGAPGAKIEKGAAALSADPQHAGRLILKLQFPAFGPEEYAFSAGPQTVRVLAVSTAQADHTWFVEAEGHHYIASGPDFVSDVAAANGKLHVVTENHLPASGTTISPPPFVVYRADGTRLEPGTLSFAEAAAPGFAAPALGTWQALPQAAEAQPNYDDAAWKASVEPLQMGADGDISAYCWYRATVKAPAAGDYRLRFANAADKIFVFINGQPAGPAKGRSGGRIAVDGKLQEGANTLALLATHYGRQKLFAHIGPIDNASPKGLSGPVVLTTATSHNEADVTVDQWVYQLDPQGSKDAKKKAAPDLKTDDGTWKPAKIGDDIFDKQRGLAWYRTTIAKVPAGATPAQLCVHFESVDDNGTVYLNGKKLATHKGWNEAFDVPVGDAWRTNGPNVLAVLVENIDNSGGLAGPVTLQVQAAGTPITNWKMRGGIAAINSDVPPAATNWQAPAAGGTVPTWYRTEFTAPALEAVGPHPIWRVTVPGLSGGFVWLNGHNLGRYPEKVHVNGLYLPESWLSAGKNTLVIFDEQGQSPEKVQLVVEQAASRSVQAFDVALP